MDKIVVLIGLILSAQPSLSEALLDERKDIHQVSDIIARCHAPKQGPEGPQGPQGIQGVPGPTGPVGPPGTPGPTSLDAFSNFEDNGGTNTTINPGGLVPFNQTPVIQGSSITQPTSTSITFLVAGTYYVSFWGTTSSAIGTSTGGTVQFQLNGSTLLNPSMTVIALGQSLILDRLITVTAGTTLQVIVEGTAITFNAGQPSAINVISLNGP